MAIPGVFFRAAVFLKNVSTWQATVFALSYGPVGLWVRLLGQAMSVNRESPVDVVKRQKLSSLYGLRIEVNNLPLEIVYIG